MRASVYDAVHFRGRLLSLLLVGVEHFEGEGVAAEGDLDDVAGFDFFGGFGGLAVDLDAPAGAGFGCDGAAFYDARDFEKLVYPHLFTCCFPVCFPVDPGEGGEPFRGTEKNCVFPKIALCDHLTDLQNADTIGKCAIMLIPALEIPYFGGRGLYLTALV